MTETRPDRRFEFGDFHYWSADALNLLHMAPWSPVSLSRQGVQHQIARMQQDGRSYRKFLAQYPAVQCEYLDTFYVFRRQTGLLDAHLISDLLLHSWREAQHAAWLAFLAPQPDYVPLLSAKREAFPHATQVFDLALAACTGTSPPAALSLAQEQGIAVRTMLAELPAMPGRLRRAPTAHQQVLMRAEFEGCIAAYRRHATAAATRLLQQGVFGHFRLSHAEWVRRGCPSAPTLA